MSDQYRHIADVAFLEFCRNAPEAEIRGLYAQELERAEPEDWKLAALERAMLRHQRSDT